MSVFDSIVNDTVNVLKTAGETTVDAVNAVAGAYIKKVTRPSVTLQKCKRNWRDERIFVSNSSKVLFTGVPEKETKTITLLNSANSPVALIGFIKRKLVRISILDIDFTFDCDFRKPSVLFSVEGLTILSKSDKIIKISNDGVEAAEIRFKRGSWTVYYEEERFATLGAAICMAAHKVRNP